MMTTLTLTVVAEVLSGLLSMAGIMGIIATWLVVATCAEDDRPRRTLLVTGCLIASFVAIVLAVVLALAVAPPA